MCQNHKSFLPPTLYVFVKNYDFFFFYFCNCYNTVNPTQYSSLVLGQEITVFKDIFIIYLFFL